MHFSLSPWTNNKRSTLKKGKRWQRCKRHCGFCSTYSLNDKSYRLDQVWFHPLPVQRIAVDRDKVRLELKCCVKVLTTLYLEELSSQITSNFTWQSAYSFHTPNCGGIKLWLAHFSTVPWDWQVKFRNTSPLQHSPMQKEEVNIQQWCT